MQTKKRWIAANWKLNKSPHEARAFCAQLPDHFPVGTQVVIFPPATSLEAISLIRGVKSFEFGLQNAFFETHGAYTGENSLSVMKELGGKWVLVGHSERRSLFGESDEEVRRKALKAQELGITPMICVGETLQERENQKTFRVLETQLERGLSGLNEKFVIAYEPVWAIGTGRVATQDQVEEVHQFIKEKIQSLGWAAAPVLYGGSVKSENAGSLICLPGVDGFLVGGASLEPQSFLSLIEIVGNSI
jgi:triosephosphate isomerase